jgi:plasmid stability protein
MAQLVVRNLEQSVKTKLQRRAKRNGHSMEEEVREILRNALKTREAEEKVGLGTRIQRRFARVGFREGEIRELRGYKPRPATFEE